MALNKIFNVFHVSIKIIPRKAKHFIGWNPLELSTRFVTDSEHKKSLSIRYLTLQAGIIFMQKIIFHTTL